MKTVKTFAHLTVDDKIFRVEKNSMEYSFERIKRVEPTEIWFGYSTRINRPNTPCQVIKGDYHKETIYFVAESDAIRYCKAQMMKTLFGLINQAKEHIKKVSDFRYNNFDLLNHKWTEEQINLLERIETEQL